MFFPYLSPCLVSLMFLCKGMIIASMIMVPIIQGFSLVGSWPSARTRMLSSSSSFILQRYRHTDNQQNYYSIYTSNLSITRRNNRIHTKNYQKHYYCLHTAATYSALFSTVSDSDNSLPQSKKKRRILYLGTPDVAATTLQTLYSASQQPTSNFEIIGVVTQPPKRRKRKSKVEPSPVGKIAEDLNIPYVLCPESAKCIEFLDQLESEICPDLCITAAYGQYLPKRFLNIPQLGTINIHPSLLPKWRGASPVQRSLQAGDNPVGVSILYTVSKMDAGPIIAQEQLILTGDETATTVLPNLFDMGTQLLIDRLPDVFEGIITFDTATAQDENAATAAAMIDSSEAELKVWEESAITCHNRLRGFSMWPQTYMWFVIGDNSESSEPMKVKILKTRVITDTRSDPTDIVTLGPTKQSGLYVTCYDGSILEILELQPATRKAFPARDFQNGYPGKTIRWIPTPINNNLEEQEQVMSTASKTTTISKQEE